MDRTNYTTRKGFFKRAGIAIAGALAVNGAAKAATSDASKSSARSASNDLPAMARVRKAEGAVARGAVR